MDTATSAAPSPLLIFETLNAHQRSAALRAAIELDLFRAIGDGLGDVASLAKKCSASERGMRILCDYLAIIGLIEKENGHYKHSSASATFLDPRSPACLASTARFLGTPEMIKPYAQLTDIVRNGRTVLPGEGTVSAENPVWVEFARSMAPMTGPAAPALASVALEGLSGPVRVLDIAAGHGLFGIAIAKQSPQARIVALDWAPVLEVAKENARSAGVEDRVELKPGSAFDVQFGGPYDLVLLTNFLHHYDPPACVKLLKKVHAALKPGGRAITLEFVPNDDRISPPPVAAFSMIMLASTASGDAYTFRELEAMHREAGFKTVTSHAISMSPQTIVVGQRA